MSRTLDTVAKTEFDTEVKHAYQGGSKLRNTVTLRTGVVGSTYDFRLMGKGQGHKRSAPSSEVTPMDVSHSLPIATLEDYEHPEYTDIFSQATVNFDEKAELAKTIGKAAGRTEDQIIIDVAAAGTYNTAATDGQGFSIAAGATKLTTAKLRSLKAYYADLEIDTMDDDVTILISGTGLDRLLENTETTSADYNAVKALVNGEVNRFLGFHFMTVGARRLEGGLGGSGLVAYAYAKSALGLAMADMGGIDVDWVPTKKSWLCDQPLKAGGAIIDPEGTAKIAFI